MDIKTLFSAMAQHDASDLHLKPGQPPVFRIGGRLRRSENGPLDATTIESLFAPLLTERLHGELSTRGYADFAIEPAGLGRFRCNYYRSAGSMSAAVRRVKPKVPTLEELHLPKSLMRITDWPDGLILVSGPTGCGKSSTIASLIDRINHQRAVHIITIEDPIEYQFIDDKALIHQRELGLDVTDFADALRSVVREDPDVLVLGELRDATTVELALHAAETGHLVFGTVHSSSAVQTINRILDLFPPNRHSQIRSNLVFNLRAVTNQHLLTASDGSGRIPAMETLFMTPIMKKFLLDGDTNRMQEALQRDTESGAEDYKRVLMGLYNAKRVTAETIMSVAPNPEEIRMALRGINFTEGGLV